jgi:BMFP domain-containing protein YqiC
LSGADIAETLGPAMSGHPTETAARALRAMQLLARDLAEARRDAAQLRRENAELRARLEQLTARDTGDGGPVAPARKG